MYRCKECGAEYEEKPDYCDCGNDEFEEVGVNIKELSASEIKHDEIPTEKEFSNQTMPDKSIEEMPKVQAASAMNFQNTEPYIPKRSSSIDSVSLTIFGMCILLSLYVIFFAWNGNINSTKTDTEIKTDNSANKNIPPIEKIWNNALPVAKKEEPKKEESVENIIKQILPVQAPKKAEVSKKTQTAVQQKVTKVPLTKVITTQKKTPVTTKSVTTSTKQQIANTNTITQEQTKKAAEAAAKQKAEQERKAAEAAQIKKLQAEQAKKAAEGKAKQEAAAKQELITYKAQLRNTIGRKIDFTHVIGDGSCTVAFRIDPSGKIINRSFAKQSSNNTLNDAVYAAVMATPTFNPPPSVYNNEILNLNIRFTNGNFEISLP